ncbi:hypothetical protein PTKIN_Ptkin17bG0060000 [Pterospermum kingtungense]
MNKASMSYNTFVLFLCMVLLASCIGQTPVSAKRVIIRITFKVHILDGFATNAKPLLLSCRSNDDDLGKHTLWKDQEFRFKFNINIFKTTHFLCDFNWTTKKAANFSVFSDQTEVMTCKQTGNCFWKTQEDGIYFSDNSQNWEKKLGW